MIIERKKEHGFARDIIMHILTLLCFRYLVAGGLVDRVSRHSRALIETDFFLDQEHESPMLVSSYDLLARICSHLRRSVDQDTVSVHGEGGGSGGGVEQTSNESHLLSTLSTTEASSAIGVLYAAVAYTPQNQKSASPTPNQTFTTAVRILASRGLKLLKSIAELDLRTLQVRNFLSRGFAISTKFIINSTAPYLYTILYTIFLYQFLYTH